MLITYFLAILQNSVTSHSACYQYCDQGAQAHNFLLFLIAHTHHVGYMNE